MSPIYMTEQAEKDMSERFELQRRAIELLNNIVLEWKTDPLSLQCFDRRIVDESIRVVDRLKTLKPSWDSL